MPSIFTTSIHMQFATACCLFFLLTTVFLGVVKIEGSVDLVPYFARVGFMDQGPCFVLSHKS